jgi:type IV pilus assembly protein PilC
MFVFGFGLVWATRFVFVGERWRDNAATVFFMRAAGALLMLLSAVSYLVASLQWGAIICVILAPIFIVAMWIRAASQHRRCLLQIAARSATLGIPADEVLEAYRMDQSSQWSKSCTALLGHLRHGIGLGEAIQQTFAFMPGDAHVAVRCLPHADDMGESLAQSLDPEDPLHRTSRRMAEILFYLGFVLTNLLFIVTYMNLRIVPVFREMFDDFAIDLPASSKLAFDFLPTVFITISGPLMLIYMTMVICGMCLYFEIIPSSVPGIDRLSGRLNVSRMLAVLGRDVRRGEKITETLDRLGRLYPHLYFARKISRVGDLVCGGMPWIDAMRKERLLATSEASALRSAEIAGNLHWALTAISESIRRKVVLRMHRMLGILGPLSIVLMAVAIGIIVVGFMEPLTQMIRVLA